MGSILRYIFTFALAICMTQLMAQYTCEIELNFSMDEFRFVPTSGNKVSLVADDLAYYYREGGESPALPVRTVNVLVPNGAELMDFNFTYKKVLVSENLIMDPAPEPLPYSIPVNNSVVKRDKETFKGLSPVEVVEFSATRIQRGYTWLSFMISPFIYDDSMHSLSLVSNLKVKIEYRLEEEYTSIVQPTEELLSIIKKSVVNPEDLDRFYLAMDVARLKSANERIDYLVITSEALKSEFEPLVEWKIRKGLRAEIIRLEEIHLKYNEPSDQLKIKRCLQDYYNNMDLKWALLAGDHDVVPVQGCFGEVTNSNLVITDSNIPTDLFYACFDNRFDWNSNADNKIGQIHRDGVDLLPEIYISRIPVRTAEQARAFVNKTLAYEQHPPETQFAEEMLLSGVESWVTWDGKSDNHHRSELMFNSSVSENWHGKKVAFFDTGTDFIGQAAYQVSSSNMAKQLNHGYGIFHFAGPGSRNALRMETGAAFSASNAMELLNAYPGIMLSTTSEVNAFDSIDPCLSEAFLRNPSGGCVAFFGNTRLGFGYSDTSMILGPSFKFSVNFFENLFKETGESPWNSFGAVATMAKSDFVFSGSSGGAINYLLYAINAMGDPELPILTSKPSTFENVRLYQIGHSLTVNTGGIKDCRICITGQDLADGYQEVAEGVSFHTFENIPDQFQVCITSPNYIPYRYYSGSATVIYNDMDPHIRVYPNPFSEILRIDVDFPSSHVLVYDIHGRMIMEKELLYGSGTFNLSEYPEGLYVLKVIYDDHTAWFKALKQSGAQ